MFRPKKPEGFLLVATGEKHNNEAIEWISRNREQINGRPATIVSDTPNPILKDLFDAVELHKTPQRSYRDKILPLIKLPYKRTIFIDTDTTIIGPLDDIFSILKSVDLVGCHAPVRWCEWNSPDVPEGFCEINSGVLGLRSSHKQRSLIKDWLRIYDEINVNFDQASLRMAIWRATNNYKLQTWVVPAEYNLRTPKPWLIGRGLAVKIIHGRITQEKIKELKEYLNSNVNTFRASSEFETDTNEIIKPYHPQLKP